MSRSFTPPSALQSSVTLTYDLWLTSWETALSALATATRGRTLSANEIAAHSAVIKAERELVTTHFTLLLGDEFPPRRVPDDVSMLYAR